MTTTTQLIPVLTPAIRALYTLRLVEALTDATERLMAARAALDDAEPTEAAKAELRAAQIAVLAAELALRVAS